jgi:hypothetical protein
MQSFPSKATFIYERILAVAPAYTGVRADMGRAYFALGDFGRAKIEFETVLSFQNLPKDLRASVEQYVKAAEAQAQSKRTLMNGYLELGFGRDNNIGGGNNADRLTFPSGGTYSPDRKGDNYSTLGLGGEINHQMTEKWSVYGGADYRGRAYQTYCDNTCNWSLDARTGLSYAGGAWLVRGGLTTGTYILNQVAYRDTVGATVDWRLALAGGNQVTLGGNFTRAAYLALANNEQNTQTNTFSAGWLTSLGDGSSIFSLTGSTGVEIASGGRADGNKNFWGPRVLLQKSFTESLGGYITAGATYAQYQGVNTYYLVKRDETLYDIAMGVTWTVSKGVSVRPQLSVLRNNSNAELYTYDKVDGSVNLRLDF